jgi:hypothetical protein
MAKIKKKDEKTNNDDKTLHKQEAHPILYR